MNANEQKKQNEQKSAYEHKWAQMSKNEQMNKQVRRHNKDLTNKNLAMKNERNHV